MKGRIFISGSCIEWGRILGLTEVKWRVEIEVGRGGVFLRDSSVIVV